jgi:zinc protease
VQGRHAIDLPGGPKLRIEVDRALPIVAGCIAWIGGQRAERPSEAGLHVLLARLLTRGDRARSGDELARELDGMAAAMAGFAGRGSVGLSFECLAADVGAVLDRALDAVIAPRFMDDEVDEERRVLIEEIEGERDDPAREVAGLARAHVYGPAHPYARRRRGTPATLERIDGALLERRWGQLYDLRDAVITVCGDVDVDAVQRRLAARLAGLPGAPRRAARSPSVRRPRALRAPIELQVKRDRAQCHVALGMPGLAVGDPRSAAMDVLLGLLVGQGGRLFMALREREGLVYHVSATASEGLDGGDVAVYAACSPAKLPRVRAVIDAELARLAAEPVPVDELERAKAGVCGQLEADRQRRARRASQMAMDELFGLGFLDEVEHVGRVMAVDAAGLHALARELFASRRRVTVIARPKASKAAARAAARKRQRSA